MRFVTERRRQFKADIDGLHWRKSGPSWNLTLNDSDQVAMRWGSRHNLLRHFAHASIRQAMFHDRSPVEPAFMEKICQIHVDIPNAPDLVLDLLAAHGAALSGKTICEAGLLLGHRESTMRVAMTRLLAGKKIQRTSRGLYAMHRPGLTLASALSTWNQEVSDEIDWQGDWVAVHDAAVVRSDKTAWRHHQLALSLRGFAAFQHGLQLRPHNRAGGVDSERCKLQALGLSRDARVFMLSHLDARDTRDVSALWPAKELTSQYMTLRKALTTHLTLVPAMPLEQALRETLLLGRMAVSQLVRDPMLPPQLMPPKMRDALIAKVQDYKEVAHGLWTQWV